MNCPNCQAVVPPANNFCEDCGTRLKEPAPVHSVRLEACEACGAGPDAIDAEGYCSRCGLQRRNPERDHIELELSARIAGVSDRGIKHYRNEDFLAVAELDDLLFGVVCDGVSNSLNADAASAAAAPATADAFVKAWRNGSHSDPEAALRSAIVGAHAAVLAAGKENAADDPPEATIVSAAVVGAPVAREAIVGWLGDSRAYFIGATQAKQLSKDHSWLVEITEAGKMSYAQAIKCKGAHSITRTLGGIPTGEGEERDEPSIARAALPEAGWVILCSDGLWNYATELDAFAKLVRGLATGRNPVELSRELVQWACQQGGKDNITVVAIAV